MCGIVALYLADQTKFVNQALVDALTMLQHRGQDAAGIVTMSSASGAALPPLKHMANSAEPFSKTYDPNLYHKFKLHLIKDTGSVADVFRQDNVTQLLGYSIDSFCNYYLILKLLF